MNQTCTDGASGYFGDLEDVFLNSNCSETGTEDVVCE